MVVPGSFPVVLFFACYLSWVGKADHPKEAMVEVTRRESSKEHWCERRLARSPQLLEEVEIRISLKHFQQKFNLARMSNYNSAVV